MKPVYAFRFEKNVNKLKRDILLTFMATQDFDEQSLTDVVDEQVKGRLVPDEFIVLVREETYESTLEKFEKSPTLKVLKTRLGADVPLFVIGYEKTGKESKVTNISGIQTKPSVQLKEIKRRAVTDIFRKHRGFVDGNANYHFQNPSWRHTERFIRLSNILVRGAEISFIAFCALPFIPKDATVAYIDTPSLYGIVGALNDQFSTLDPHRPPILADNFGSYSGIEEYPFERVSESVVIISASTSGGMARTLFKQKGIPSDQIFHILYLGEKSEEVSVLCNLEEDEAINPNGYPKLATRTGDPDDCKMCKEGSKAIPLIGDQFDIGGPQLSPIEMKKDHAPTGLASLLDRIGGQGAFKVGLGGAQNRLPRQFHIESSALLNAPEFKKRLEYLLDRSIPGKVSHIICINNDSLVWGNFAKDRCKLDKAVLVKVEEVDNIEQDTSTPVLVVADTIESGRSLQDMSRDLRSVCPSAPIIYLVGLSKNTGDQRRASLAKTLTQSDKPFRHVYLQADEILLPASEEESAWSKELNLLRDKSFQEVISEESKAFFERRKEVLERSSVPLDNNLFLPKQNGEELSIQPGFVYWRENWEFKPLQSDVYYTISSVLQRLRANAEDRQKQEKIISNWFQQTLIAPRNFGRFNDGVVQASILRAAQPNELNFGTELEESKNMARIIIRIIESADKDRGEAASEFLMALCIGQLKLTRDHLQNVAAKKTKFPVLDTMLKYCRALI
ncbi:MAG: hypothetical protein R3F51_15025 [Cyanobacteriota/Melainabacteria group bacterium]